MEGKLSNEVAFITGGASGMGREMALRWARSGGHAAVFDRDPAMLASLVAAAPSIIPFQGDVTDGATVAAAVAEAERTIGPLTRLAAAAGIMPALSISEMPADRFAQVMRVNYEGLVNAVTAVLPSMVQRGKGEIILFGSLAGVVPSKNFAAYNASKAAINMFGEVLAEEMAGSGVKVLTVRPAAVRTPLIDQATGVGGLKGLERQARGKSMATPDQIIDAIESGLKRGAKVVYPTGEAKFGQFIRRLSPTLTWKIVNAANR